MQVTTSKGFVGLIIRHSTPSDPPDLAWQHRAERVVSLAEETLWSSEGESALKYLLGRGLSTATIRQARLGYVLGDYRARRTLEGLEVPCGITVASRVGDGVMVTGMTLMSTRSLLL